MLSSNRSVQRVIAVFSAALMAATVPMIWIYSYDHRGVNPLEGFTEPMGLFTIPLSLVALILAGMGHRWTASVGLVGIGTGLMAIFRIWTGTTITMTDLSVAYGVYVEIGASILLTLAAWPWRTPSTRTT